MLSLRKATKNIQKSPLSLLTIDVKNHNYSHCKDEFCAECNFMADEIITQFKINNNKRGRVRLSKFQMLRLIEFFGSRITKKAVSRFNQSDIYQRAHYNIIPCSCRVKSHNDCVGYHLEKLEDSKSKITVNCKCKRHTRLEKKFFKQNAGKIYL